MPYEVKITVTQSAIATEADAEARSEKISILVEQALASEGVMTADTVIGAHPVIEYEEDGGDG